MKIGSEDGSKIIEIKALVDTGAILTVIPREIARELGLRATGRSKVETGAGGNRDGKIQSLHRDHGEERDNTRVDL